MRENLSTCRIKLKPRWDVWQLFLNTRFRKSSFRVHEENEKKCWCFKHVQQLRICLHEKLFNCSWKFIYDPPLNSLRTRKELTKFFTLLFKLEINTSDSLNVTTNVHQWTCLTTFLIFFLRTDKKNCFESKLNYSLIKSCENSSSVNVKMKIFIIFLNIK